MRVTSVRGAFEVRELKGFLYAVCPVLERKGIDIITEDAIRVENYTDDPEGFYDAIRQKLGERSISGVRSFIDSNGDVIDSLEGFLIEKKNVVGVILCKADACIEVIYLFDFDKVVLFLRDLAYTKVKDAFEIVK